MDQATLTAALSAQWGGQHFNRERLSQIHRSTLVGGRYLALPLDEYAALGGFGKRNEAYLPRTSSGKLRRQEALRRFQAGTLAPPRRVSAFGLALGVARSRLAPLFGQGCRVLP